MVPQMAMSLRKLIKKTPYQTQIQVFLAEHLRFEVHMSQTHQNTQNGLLIKPLGDSGIGIDTKIVTPTIHLVSHASFLHFAPLFQYPMSTSR